MAPLGQRLISGKRHRKKGENLLLDDSDPPPPLSTSLILQFPTFVGSAIGLKELRSTFDGTAP